MTSPNTIIADIVSENETLRARLAELEKQEPVGKTIDATTNTGYVLCTFNGRGTTVGTKLYAAPVVGPDVEKLKDEISELKSHNKLIMDMYVQYSDENQSLKTELEAARKDAARWRKYVELYSVWHGVPEEDVADEIDEAIDAAKQKEKPIA